MNREELVAIARSIYAKQVTHAAGVNDPLLESVLAGLPRERFLSPPPWLLSRWGYQATPDDEPVYLYQDVPVAIDPERHLNNGQPSFLVRLIAHGRPRPGDSIVHIGTGTGYYTAVLAGVVGAKGHVFGVEHDPGLAARRPRISPIWPKSRSAWATAPRCPYLRPTSSS